MLSALGVVARLPEYQLDAVTGLSGSGPAYVFLLAEALVEAGVNEGLDREVSRLLAVQTLLGSARLLAETGDSPEKPCGPASPPRAARRLRHCGSSRLTVSALRSSRRSRRRPTRSRELGREK